MKVHHLNCGTMCPLGARLLPGVFPRRIVSHCLLIEERQRLVLVDTGVGLNDIGNRWRMGLTGWALAPRFAIEETAHHQIKALGYSPEDVTDVIPTHLDLDHAGGIADFPRARVHVARPELEAARRRRGLIDGQRYRSHQLPEGSRWQVFEPDTGESWNGLRAVKPLDGLPPEILLVGLPGHTAGHTGVAVVDGERTLLHAGDAYYHHNELTAHAKAPLGLRLFQRLIHADFATARATQQALTRMHAQAGVAVFCSHDPLELERAQRAS